MPGLLGQDAHHAGDDQVGALHLCAPVRADRRPSSRPDGLPALRTLAWILVAMVAARSCAMAFNRWADADLDAANPRTRTRAIPAGRCRANSCWDFTHPVRGSFCRGRRGAKPAHALPVAAGPGGPARLQLHEAHHALVAPGAGTGTGARALGSMDCGARLARSAHPGTHRGGDAVGGRL